MLQTIAILLIILWALGLVSEYSLGGFIHSFIISHRNYYALDRFRSGPTNIIAAASLAGIETTQMIRKRQLSQTGISAYLHFIVLKG